MDVLGERGARLARCAALSVAQELEAGLDVEVGRVELRGAPIGVQGIIDLIVARLVLSTRS
jgi:hypothetical protein